MAHGFGSPSPWFKASVLDGNSNYSFHTVAGRPVLLFVMGSAAQPSVKEALDRILRNSALFDDVHCCFFGVTSDPQDAEAGLIRTRIPGIRYFLDYDRHISQSFGCCVGRDSAIVPTLVVLDRQLRVSGRYALHEIEAALGDLASIVSELRADDWAPVLNLPRVFEPELCKALIDQYEAQGGNDSGFMREVDGKTVPIIDYSFKKRNDFRIADPDLRAALVSRIDQRIRPAVKRAFQFEATRVERYIVACYDAGVGGFFRPHRDNTTKGTAHRRFAVTINLNSEDYEGGELRFPEFGPRTYRASTGGAVIFSCELLHEATPVTKGTRYAFLPFLYDDAAAEIRERNNAFLGEGVGVYSNT